MKSEDARALEELTHKILRYGEYGLTPETIDEILVVFEKRTPKKVSDETFDSFTYGYCPICRTYLADDETYCPSCGQALKWGE